MQKRSTVGLSAVDGGTRYPESYNFGTAVQAISIKNRSLLSWIFRETKKVRVSYTAQKRTFLNSWIYVCELKREVNIQDVKLSESLIILINIYLNRIVLRREFMRTKEDPNRLTAIFFAPSPFAMHRRQRKYF